MSTLYASNNSNEELSSSLNRLSINTNISSNSNPSNNSNSNTNTNPNSNPNPNTNFTILKIKNIPRDISLREAFLIFSLCLNDINFVDIIHEPISNTPIIYSQFYSPNIANQVHQLLNDKPLFGTSFPAVQCEIIHNNNNGASNINHNPNPLPSSNSYLFSNPFASTTQSSSPTSPTLQGSKFHDSTESSSTLTNNNNNNNNLMHSLNRLSTINGSTGNITGWTNDTSTPLATPSNNNSKILRPDPLLLNSTNLTLNNANNSNLSTPVITDWPQSQINGTNNTINNNSNNGNNGNNATHFFNSNALNLTDLTTPSSANFSLSNLQPHPHLESPLDSQNLDSINTSLINDSFNDNSLQLNTNSSHLQRHHSHDIQPTSNQQDIMRRYQSTSNPVSASTPTSSTFANTISNPAPNSNGSISNNIASQSQSSAIPDLSLLARVPPPANPADQNPPCNTLYVGNLPPDTTEIELRTLFQTQPGFKRLSFRTKQTNGVVSHHGPMCFVEFDDVAFATRALAELYGRTLPRVNGNSSNKGGIRLSFSKNPLGVRGPGQQRRNNSNSNGSTNSNTNNNGTVNTAISNNNTSAINATNISNSSINNYQRNNSIPMTNSMNFNNNTNINGFGFMGQKQQPQYHYQS